MAGSAGLITYNTFANPNWIRFRGLPPAVLLSALALHGAYNNDKACIGGIAAGYVAFLFL